MTDTALATRTWNGVTIPEAGSFSIDAAHTRVGFVARHMMVSKVRGSFTDVAGTVVIADEPASSSVDVTIQTASFTTGAPDRDAHVKSGDFLDVEKYPTLTFVSRLVKDFDDNEFVLVGDLTVRGVTREVELKAEFEGVARSPWGAEVIGFSATGEIDREEFGITWNAALETGGVLVSEKITLEFEVSAIKVEPQA